MSGPHLELNFWHCVGTLDITPTQLVWSWHRNQDGEAVVRPLVSCLALLQLPCVCLAFQQTAALHNVLAVHSYAAMLYTCCKTVDLFNENSAGTG